MNTISLDWRHLSAAVAVLLIVASLLIFRATWQTTSQTTLSQTIPAGSNATVDNDAPKPPISGVPSPNPIR